MTPVPLYLSFGMPKSGSTLAFELTRTMLEMAGFPQDKLSEGATDPKTKTNFVKRLDGPALDKLLEQVGTSPGPRVIKTHSKLFPRVETALEKKVVIGHAVCRDPRDMALSLMDAAREGRAWGKSPEGIYRTVADTEKRLRASITQFEEWVDNPNVLVVRYELLAFDTERVAREIATQLGITVDLPKAVEIATGSKFTQFNRGQSQRWKTEMDPADARRLAVEFKDYIEEYCQDVVAEPKPHRPRAGWFGKWFAKKSEERLIR